MYRTSSHHSRVFPITISGINHEIDEIEKSQEQLPRIEKEIEQNKQSIKRLEKIVPILVLYDAAPTQ
jgi:hypothetical protein